MNERQAYALTHPADNPLMVLDERLKSVRKHARGFLLMAILAVDR